MVYLPRLLLKQGFSVFCVAEDFTNAAEYSE